MEKEISPDSDGGHHSDAVGALKAKGGSVGKTIHFKVDNEPHQTTEEQLTPNYIIAEFGQKDVATHYLVRIKGNQSDRFEGVGDVPIEIHNGDRFQIVSTGPTTVSDATRFTGAEAFKAGLEYLGYTPMCLPNRPDHVYFEYHVETGKMVGRVVELGFVVPANFPMVPPSGPHICPPIHVDDGSGVHPAGGTHDSTGHSQFPQETNKAWQYWSRPVREWKKHTVAEYMNHVWQLWHTQ